MRTHLKTLSYEEKVRLLMAETYWGNHSLGGKVYAFTVSDGPVGLRCSKNIKEGGENGCYPAVAYPSMQMLAQTWDVGLAREMGQCLADDCIARGVDILLAPGINLKRMPSAGRNFEYLSEDPFLAGTLAKAYVEGVQEKHVGATVKHYCANNLEYCRHYASSEVDERTLRELYLRAFEIAVEAQPYMVMTSYNLVNGVRMAANRELLEILRREFGFEGVVVTDWEACKNAYESIMAGTTMIFPYNTDRARELDAIAERRSVPEEIVDDAAARVLRLAERCEANRALQKIERTEEERSAVALKIAEEGIVLLKNNGVLPLRAEASVLMTGAPCRVYYAGEGSSKVVLRKPFEGLDAAYVRLGGRAEYCRSTYFELMTPWMNRLCGADIPVCCARAAEADVTVIAVGNEPGVESEFYDRERITLSRVEEQTIADIAAHAKKTVVVVYAGAPVDMSAWIDRVDAVVWGGFGGENASEAIAKVLLGLVNPSGRLAETFPLRLEDVPAEHSYRDSFVIRYEEGLRVGYRHFEAEHAPVRFPFGFGLSYSEFAYSDLAVRREGDRLKVAFCIKNVSDRDGKETAQVYVGACGEVAGLKGFAKLFLKAHEVRRVEVEVPVRSLRSYVGGTWQLAAQTYRVAVGKNAREIVLSENIAL